MTEETGMAPHAVQRGETPARRRAVRPANIRVPPLVLERDSESDDEYAASVRRAAGGIWKRSNKPDGRLANRVEARSDSDSDDPKRKNRLNNPPPQQQQQPSSPDTPTRPSNRIQQPAASLRPVPAVPAVPAAPSRPVASFPPGIAIPEVSAPPLRVSAPALLPPPAATTPPKSSYSSSTSRPPTLQLPPIVNAPAKRPTEPEDPPPPPPPVLAPAEPEPEPPGPPPPPEPEPPGPPPPPPPPPPTTMTVTAPARTVTLISTMMTTIDSPSPKKPNFPTPLPPPPAPPMTTGLPPLPSVEPSAPRKGIDGHTTPTVTATLASAVIPAETISALPGQAGSDRGKDDGRPPRMNPETEHALIAVGSIGSFIFASFLVWIVWRTLKRAARRKRERESGFPGDRPGLGSKIPFFKNRSVGGGWENLDGQSQMPSQYEKGPRGTLRLDTNFYGPDGKSMGSNFGPGSAFGGNYTMSPADNRGSPINSSPVNTIQLRGNPMNGQAVFNSPQAVYSSQVGTFNSQTGTFVSHAPSQSITQIIGSYGTSSDPSMTLRSGMGAGAYFNQSELARQPSDAYDPSRRRVNRASELSSISSGFGDGDIIVPGMALQPPPPVSQQYLTVNQNGAGRLSWTSKSNRETVYTETSEDLPPRFRSVNSWVNQQTGRIKRAQDRPQTDDEDVPPVPGLPAGTGQNGLPPEPQFTMMMPDGEVPRRPDLGPSAS
ncbi:hypothetical protein CMUS01_07010 [Colletotrichum musicola]|uniref:Uncharacterized protein n=1 Tax=Colletotrichum musicola TaxID=2175873 RepID=A0A8H6KIR9_9PEZI|nr:hypothetical protein CMUS01_07010 [Colletotrichum musicola]